MFVSDERAQSDLEYWEDECAWIATAAVSHASTICDLSRNANIFIF